MEIFNLILGVILLLFGRKLFWLFIGIAGFLFGLEISRIFFGGHPPWLQLAMAIVLGCLGALLAMLAQRLAFALSGLFAGVFLALKAGQALAITDHAALVLLVIGAGVSGALIATLIMNMAITILACLVGAAAIVGALSLGPALASVIFVVLAGAGFLFQEKLLAPEADDRPA